MRMARVRSVITLITALALVLPVASVADAQSKGTIKIASQSPLSGGQAVLGEGIKLGTQLAVEKMKGNLEKMGYKVDFVPFDDQAKPDVGVANAKNIIADKDIMVVIVRGLQGSYARDDLPRQHQPGRHGSELPQREPGVRP
jgi:ABC-type branched-subunit amino acid transport system substrate-binding protein